MKSFEGIFLSFKVQTLPTRSLFKHWIDKPKHYAMMHKSDLTDDVDVGN
jgi:hypothetical protein